MVWGQGPRDARIALVGEAPGAQEDSIGSPFVGRAGKYLDKVLLKSSLRRDAVFITNAVKCRPPGNRRPTVEEIEACNNWLVEEIEAIRPRIIVPLGQVALYALTGERSKLGGLVGRPMHFASPRFKSIIVPCYHPAAAMRNRKMSDKFEWTISLAKGLSEEPK